MSSLLLCQTPGNTGSGAIQTFFITFHSVFLLMRFAPDIAAADARVLHRLESELETLALDVFTVAALGVLRDFYADARAREPLDAISSWDDPKEATRRHG